nr:hypothetical protein [Pseudomonas sp. BIGb0427]
MGHVLEHLGVIHEQLLEQVARDRTPGQGDGAGAGKRQVEIRFHTKWQVWLFKAAAPIAFAHLRWHTPEQQGLQRWRGPDLFQQVAAIGKLPIGLAAVVRAVQHQRARLLITDQVQARHRVRFKPAIGHQQQWCHVLCAVFWQFQYLGNRL